MDRHPAIGPDQESPLIDRRSAAGQEQETPKMDIEFSPAHPGTTPNDLQVSLYAERNQLDVFQNALKEGKMVIRREIWLTSELRKKENIIKERRTVG